MFKHWKWSQVHCTTHASLWTDLGMNVMDGVADISSSFAELYFIIDILDPVFIKLGQIVATAIQIDSIEMLPDIEQDNDKSIPSAESVFACVKKMGNFMYPCIISDKMIDADEEDFDLDMDIVEAPLSRPRAISREKGILIDSVQDLFIKASKHLSPEESAKVKELLVKHNETTFHDPEKPLLRTDTIVHEILTTGKPVRIPPCRIPLGQTKIIEDEILKLEKEGNIQKSSGPWCSPIVLVR